MQESIVHTINEKKMIKKKELVNVLFSRQFRRKGEEKEEEWKKWGCRGWWWMDDDVMSVMIQITLWEKRGNKKQR